MEQVALLRTIAVGSLIADEFLIAENYLIAVGYSSVEGFYAGLPLVEVMVYSTVEVAELAKSTAEVVEQVWSMVLPWD